MDMFIQPCSTTFGGRVLSISTFQEIRAVAHSGGEARLRVFYRGDREGDKEGDRDGQWSR